MSLRFSNVFAYDDDAGTYIQAVETADGQALEAKTRLAINDFVIGCKADGIWNAIKASCILAGARTLNGALVPLKGAAPTNFNFVSGDYNRKTGLVGNGSTKYLNSNRAANADPQNNMHLTVFASTVSIGRYIGAYSGVGTADDFLGANGDLRCRSVDTPANLPTVAGFLGASRTTSTAFTARRDQQTVVGLTASSAVPGGQSIFVFAQNDNGSRFDTVAARLAYYSIGESLDLALLDARVTTLINLFASVIP